MPILPRRPASQTGWPQGVELIGFLLRKGHALFMSYQIK